MFEKESEIMQKIFRAEGASVKNGYVLPVLKLYLVIFDIIFQPRNV